jgi:ribonuclease D
MAAEVSEAADDQPDTTDPDVTPLLYPPDGVPDLSTTAGEIKAAAELLAGGHGPFAIDAERASGFRYSNRAYLIQVRRAGAGTVLIDPVSHGGDSLSVLRPVAAALADDEWILHAADQDLPCLAEVGLRPPALYDTELAGRLAGFDRVNLAAMAQRLLGVGLAKGHGAADWSRRPLPAAWLNYAALDVEVLIGLREAISAVLAEQGKTGWAAEEFDYLRTAVDQAPPSTRRDRWRRTSGIHKVRNQRGLAAVREMWSVRDEIAQRRDIAPGRILPDSAIIDAATADPKTLDDLTALPIFGGRRQRRSAATWLAALEAARENPGPAEDVEPPNGPPAPARWARRKPEAAARLDAARSALRELSEQVAVPAENLVTPELVRRLCWDWERAGDDAVGAPPAAQRLGGRSDEEERRIGRAEDAATTIDEFLAAGQARRWQRELVVPVLAAALQPTPEHTDDVSPGDR